MATTTNYGWVTPDDTALVKDGAAAIRTLGTSIDTTTFNNASAAIVKTIVDAKGDIIAATAADTVSRLAVGANDTVLIADSTAATGLKWGAAPSKVVQIVAATTTTAATSSSAVFADSGLTATITPTSASNKILVLCSMGGCIKDSGNSSTRLDLKLLRASTQIGFGTAAYHSANTGYNYIGSVSWSILDTPATTSATTYKVQFATNGSGAVGVQTDSSTSSIVLMEVTP
jgi:hypothetical protein